jgi:hypothetical protein
LDPLDELIRRFGRILAAWIQSWDSAFGENTTLKQRVGQRNADNRTLDERLKAAHPAGASKTGSSPTSKPSSQTGQG